MPLLIRSASLTGYAELAQSLGLDPYALLREAGLQRRCLQDPETRIEVGAAGRLLEASARAAGVEDFGLRMAERRRLSNLGPISLVMREEPTARKALDTLSRYMRLLNESLSIRIEDADRLVIIKEELMIGERAPARQAIELAVGVLYRMLRELLGPDWEPRRVCFTHRAPGSLASHVRVFGRFVEFGHDFNGIVCLARDLETRNPSADPMLAQYARQMLDGMFARPNMSTADKVRQLIYALLPLGHCTVEQVAQQLGMDRRTVHRHLAGDGATFSSMVNQVRAELAVRYIEDGGRSLSDVAGLLGFSALSALSRWFRGEFGCSVSAWKRRRPGRQNSISKLP